MDYMMDNSQNTAPDGSSNAQAAKLSAAPRKQDTLSVTKRWVLSTAHCEDRPVLT